jgi:hypothetical protein
MKKIDLHSNLSKKILATLIFSEVLSLGGVRLTVEAAPETKPAVVLGGVQNEATGANSSVSGGEENKATGNKSSVTGGYNNVASGHNTSVTGGHSNTASTGYASISGGNNGKATGASSSISGGASNTAEGEDSSVSGGSSNVAHGTGASVSGGEANKANGMNASVAGGRNNTADEDYSFAAGGNNNIAGGYYGTAVGGVINKTSNTNASAFGGVGNTVSGLNATAVGSYKNTASGWGAVTVGGSENNAAGTTTTALGGINNTAMGTDSVVMGGTGSVVLGRQSTGIGGGSTGADALNGTAIGMGAVTTVENGMALGYQSVATEMGTVSFGHVAGAVSGYASDGNGGYTENHYDADHYNRLVNVADGKAPHDAATVAQTTRDVTSTDNSISVTKSTNEDGSKTFDLAINTSGNIAAGASGLVTGDAVHRALDELDSRLTDDINRVGAGAAALAALHPLDYNPHDKFEIATGLGHYKNSNAAAIGAFYHPNDRVMLSMAGTLGNGSPMLNLGATFKLDAKPEQYLSRYELEDKVKAQEVKLQEQDSKMQAMAAELAELKEMLKKK